jgi:hypothetical protein
MAIPPLFLLPSSLSQMAGGTISRPKLLIPTAGEFPGLKAKIYTTLAALSWQSHTTQIRVYCRSNSGKLVERQYDGDDWEESEDELVALNSIADDAQLAVIERPMSSRSVLQAYFVSGKEEIGEVLRSTSAKWLLPIEKFKF